MNNWKKCKLGDIIDVKHGYAFKGHGITSKDNNKILVTPGNFNIGGGFKMDKCKYFEGNFPESYILKHNDIVLTMTDLSVDSDTLGYSAKIPNIKNKIFLHNQRIGLVIFNDNCVDRDFIYWLTRSPEYHNYIVCSSTGTSIRHTSPRLIKEFVFELPPLEEQRQIAAILSSIDDKIELLHEQNKTLEELAQTLFRHYFIENPNPSWQEKPLSDFGNIICGKTPSKKVDEYYNGDIPFIKIPDMHGNIFVFKTNECLSELGSQTQINKFIPKKSICISCIATVGVVSMNAFESHTNQQINSIIPKKEHYRYFLYLYMKHLYDYLQSMASGGTATANLNTRDFSNIHILMPDEEMMINFNGKTSEYFDKIFKNLEQIQTLENMRDILIPKLLNGEIKINN